MKMSLDYYSKLLAFRPFDKELRHKCFTLSRKYYKTRKEKRRNYFKSLVDKLKNIPQDNPKEFWNVINTLKHNESEICDPPVDAKSWLAHFKELNQVGNEKSSQDLYFKNILKVTPTPGSIDILDEPLSIKEISRASCKLKNNKTSGPDGILNEMLKYGQFALLPSLKKLFNLVLESGIYPDQWSEGFIVPIFKNGDSSNPDNYRGITVTSCLGK